jgi:hypothetical protein
MAISYSAIDISGDGSVTKDGIDIGTDEIVLKENLAAFEEVHLEAALAETALADYTMPNGKTADVFFAEYSNALADLQAVFKRNRIKGDQVGAIGDLEDRVTTLEP